MDFFCIPLVCGCKTIVTPEGDPTQRLCPHCHNYAVFSSKSKEYFELCFVPLFPLSKKHVWLCGICGWSAPIQQGWEPMRQPYNYYPQAPGPPPNVYWPQNTGH